VFKRDCSNGDRETGPDYKHNKEKWGFKTARSWSWAQVVEEDFSNMLALRDQNMNSVPGPKASLCAVSYPISWAGIHKRTELKQIMESR
jgi:hypothetical protein